MKQTSIDDEAIEMSRPFVIYDHIPYELCWSNQKHHFVLFSVFTFII